MCNQNEWIVREAFLAYDRGDVTRMMDFVDPEVDWTYRDPELADSEPQLCHGRGELEKALRRQAGRRLRAQLEEVIAAADRRSLHGELLAGPERASVAPQAEQNRAPVPNGVAAVMPRSRLLAQRSD